MKVRIISFFAAVIVMLTTFPVSADAAYKPPNLTFKNSQGAVVGTFSHDFHLQIYGKCRDCHTKLFPFGNGKRMTMADMAAGKSCGACHDGKTAFTANGDCNRCHTGYKPANLTFKNSQGAVVGTFSHDFHVQVYKCGDCHTKLYPYGNGKRMTMADMDAGKSCGACHNGKTAFAASSDCNKCHVGIKPGNVTFKIANSSLKGYFSHDSHLQIYKCGDCHTKLFSYGNGKRVTHADMNAGKSCGACHDGKTAFGPKPNCAKCHRKQ